MLALSAVATLVALLIAGVSIAGVLGRVVTMGIDRRLDAQLTLIASAVGRDGEIDRGRLRSVQPLLDPGPGWRWRIDAPGGSIGSDDLPVAAPTPPGPRRPERGPGQGPGPGPGALDGRDRSGDQLHARQVTVETGAGQVVLTAAAPRDVITQPVRSALAPLLATLALLGAVLGMAAVVQIRLGLRPVRRLRAAVGAIRRGDAHAVDSDQPAELRPLAEELNALVRENEAALATARASAANLAHALKTPVATLGLELAGDPRRAQVDRIDTTIRHHLARAKAATASTRAATPLAPAIAELATTITRLRGERGVAMRSAVAADLVVAVDPADLDELAGNLIDNAARHARASVSIEAQREGRLVRLVITDDGPGIPAADRARATAPGVRLDERSDGHGFGLAISRDLAELHGGTLSLEDAPGGGLRATVTLPHAHRDDKAV